MFRKFQKGGQFAYEMLVPTIKKNLTRRRSEFEKTVKGTDDALKGLSKETKVDVKSKGGIKKTVSKISKIIDDAEKKGLDMKEKKAKGGRVGLKFGSRKSNVQKIKETFGPKNTKKLSSKQMKIAKLAGNPKKIDAQDLAKLRGRG